MSHTIGNAVASLRSARDWSKRRLAREAGVGVMSVLRVEAGASCQFRTIAAIAEALGVPVSHLLEDARRRPSRRPAKRPDAPPPAAPSSGQRAAS